jgi:hypothetical protein
MTTLKEALTKGKLEEFIKEHKDDAPGDADKAEAILASMVGKSKATPAASDQDGSEN